MFRPKEIEIVNFISHKYSKFAFRQGRAVLVVGQNLDKEGQKGNGAGKSTINEAISVAISGSSIRDVLTRELVRDEEESSTIIFTLENLRDLSNPLVIERVLYSNKNKSSTCRIWIGEDEVKTCPDINSYNKFIFDTLGITKDDFYNFYLITKEKYQPFFSIGDTGKKAIINRFSGANSIDGVDELIKFDSSDIQSKIDQKDREKSSIEGKISLLEEQKLAEEEKNSEEEIAKQKEEISKKITAEERLKKDIDTTLKDLGLTLLEEEQELKNHLKSPLQDNTELYKEIESNLEQIPKDREALQLSLKDNDTFKAEIDQIKKDEESSTEDVNLFKGEQKKLTDEKTRLEKENKGLENHLQGNITCPKCTHEFNLQEKDFDITKAKSTIEANKKRILVIDKEVQEIGDNILEYDEVFQEIEKRKGEVNDKVKKRADGIRKQISDLDQVEGEWKDVKTELDKEKKVYDDKTQELEGKISRTERLIKVQQNNLESSEGVIESYKEKLKTVGVVDKVKIKEIEEQIKLQEEKKETLLEQLETLMKEKQEIDSWITNFKNFKSHLANQSISNITDYTNYFLKSISSNITIKVDGYKMLSNGKLKEEITTVVYKDGFEKGSYGKFSAGERGRVEICSILALRELINLNSTTGGLDLLICDEILDSVDTLGLELLIESLQDLNQTILIVSQNEINSLSENTILIRKENSISSIIG